MGEAPKLELEESLAIIKRVVTPSCIAVVVGVADGAGLPRHMDAGFGRVELALNLASDNPASTDADQISAAIGGVSLAIRRYANLPDAEGTKPPRACCRIGVDCCSSPGYRVCQFVTVMLSLSLSSAVRFTLTERKDDGRRQCMRSYAKPPAKRHGIVL